MFHPSSATHTAQLTRRAEFRRKWLVELGQLLAFPTISALPRHRSDIEAAARWLAHHLHALGIHSVSLLPKPHGGLPSVYGEWLGASGKPTLLLYGHYDVQPVDPLHAWTTPPFQATHIGQNLYARGASDDKGQFFIHLKAIESYLLTSGRLPLNIKIWLEGDEEIGSPHLEPFLAREAERLHADAVLISDTQMVAPGRPSLVYGLRGRLAGELRVTGPAHDLHSGHYGGAVLDPIQAVSDIVASLHDPSGRIAVASFYDGVREVPTSERRYLRQFAPTDQQLLRETGAPAPWGEPNYSLHERRTIRPSLTFTGMTGGYTGPGGKAIIPQHAMLRLDARLVPDQQPAAIAAALEHHIASVAPPGIHTNLEFTAGTAPVLISRQHAALQAASRAVQRIWEVPPIYTRSGGTIPVVEQLQRKFDVPVVLLGFGLPTDSPHGPNEKLHLPNFFRGIETIILFFAEYANDH